MNTSVAGTHSVFRAVQAQRTLFAENAENNERNRRLDARVVTALKTAGVFRMLVPESLNGLEIHPLEFFNVLAELARSDGATGWVSMIGATTGMLSASLAEHWSEQIYGANPNVLSVGVTAPIGKAQRDGDDLIVSGRWPFGSGSELADWICGGCTLTENGEPVLNQYGQPETLLAFFPAAEVAIHDTWYTSGLCGTGSHDIEVQSVRVPKGRWVVLGRRARVDKPLYRFPTLGLLALGVSAVSIGLAENALRCFTDMADGKVPTGATRSLKNRSSAQKDLARATALISSARALTEQRINQAWQQASSDGRLNQTMKADLRLAATNNTWSATQAIDLLYHLGGGSSIYQSNVLQRCLRDVHVTTQHIMVAQPTYEMVGKVMLGLDPKTLL